MNVENLVHYGIQNDGNLLIQVSENHKVNPEVLNYVQRLVVNHKENSVIKFVAIDEVSKLNSSNVSNLDVNAKQAKVLEYFKKAIEINSSDLHFTIGRNGSEYCYVEARVHGELCQIDCIPRDDGRALAATILQGMCDVTDVQFDDLRIQNARVSEHFLKPLGIFGARYAHIPSVGGIYSVMRLICDDGDHVPSFLELGYLPEQVKVIKKVIRRPHGIIIMCGPTGSGKSTTLRSMSAFYLSETGFDEKLPRKRLLTIEDPPEGIIHGAVQTPIVADKTDEASEERAWVNSIRQALRLDPDAILDGEIRDLYSAMAALKAAMTGHLVFATLHANDPINILERLEIEGAPVGLISDPQLMIGLVSQRLVQRLCPKCKKKFTNFKSELDDYDRELIEENCESENVFLRNYSGCDYVGENGERCYKGIVGRIAIAEVVSPDVTFFDLYKTKGKAAARSYWVHRLNGVTMNQHVLHYINHGDIDPLCANLVSPIDEDKYTIISDGR